MRFVGKSENGKKRSSDGSESRLLAKIKMAFTERSLNGCDLQRGLDRVDAEQLSIVRDELIAHL